jgi:hypothetical protein
MSVEQRMAKHAEDTEAGGNEHLAPLLKERLSKPRNVFSPGHRIRMNIVPMFLMIFIPWGIFIFVLGLSSFNVMYMKPFLGYGMLMFCVFCWVMAVLLAINRRKYDPEPGWYGFFAIVSGLAIFFGWYLGNFIYNTYSFPYYQVRDLKTISNLDVSTEHGQNVMDAGSFYFAEGNKLDAKRAWHFKQKTVYCVAPVMKGKYPETQSFDFWAVGKDCCSISASDFRCGAYNNPMARGGIRNMNDADRAFYRLAIEQAVSLYGIQATHPVMFEWVVDPAMTVNGWNNAGFKKYLVYCCFALVFFLFAMAMASCKFSFLGRAESVYGEEIYSDPDWQQGGIYKKKDLHTRDFQY